MEASHGAAERTAFRILLAISFCHLLNDLVQSLLPAIYPMLRTSFSLSFSQLGLLTLTFQMTASVCQPFIGLYTDRKPQPFSLPTGVAFTLGGLLVLAVASSYQVLVAGAALVGLGSAVFHPESSRVARLASGGQHGLAQSIFQLGGTFGAALGPLLAALIVLPHGQKSLAWFSVTVFLAFATLLRVARWYQNHQQSKAARQVAAHASSPLPRKTVAISISILIVLVFSKYVYLASLTSYYTFYLMSKFGLSAQSAQIYLFLFLGSAAVGTFAGGPIGDRIGRKYVIWGSILGVLPFTLVLPHVGLFATAALTVAIGFVLSSAFSAILVYAQELVPGRIGMISGLFFGLAFGMAGIGAALLGNLADHTSIEFVYQVCAYLPALGLLTAFLPNIDGPRSGKRLKAEAITPANPAPSELVES
jgi:MFS transporter, FSR family, fosmidomycin resistance protein